MTASTVSIALATYNGAAFLADQLATLAAQTRLPDELVIGDDRSTDATCDIIAQFARTAPYPVRLAINPVQLGPAANFAATIRRCTGSLVFPCDQDDLWEPGKIARMIAFLAERPACLLAIHDAALVEAAGAPLGHTLADQIRGIGADPAGGLMHGCCMAIDARLAALFDPATPMRSHDSWIAVAADALHARAYCDEPLIRHRRHETNASWSYMGRSRRTGWLQAQLLRGRLALAESPARSLATTVATRESVAAAIRAHRAALTEVVPGPRIGQALAALEAALAADRARLAVHVAHGPRRLARLAQAARAGCYRGATGPITLARDLLFALLPVRA